MDVLYPEKWRMEMETAVIGDGLLGVVGEATM